MTPKERREAAMRKQQAIVNAAKADGNRSLTAEEQAEFNRYQCEIEQADAEIAEQERGMAGGTGASQSLPEGTPQAAGFRTVIPPVTEAAEGQKSEMEAERARVTEIMALCRDFDTDPSEYIRNGFSLEQVRGAILEGMRRTGSPVGVRVTRDEGDTFRQRASDALMLRAGVQVETPAEGAN